MYEELSNVEKPEGKKPFGIPKRRQKDSKKGRGLDSAG
jgi:hypothetical protein